MTRIPIALTMFTVRDEAAKNYLDTVARVAKMGYAGIQTHLHACDAPSLKRLADDLGLQIAGVHSGFEAMRNGMSEVIDFNLALGCRDVTCPYLPEEFRGVDGLKKAGEVLNSAGREAATHGLRLTYHNHAFEFDDCGGRTGFDVLFETLDPEVVGAELDVYWLRYGGQDPLAYIKRFAGRLPLLHIKDMEADGERFFAEIGEGVIDWQGVFAAAEGSGVEWMIVEQDACRRPPMESAQLSLRNLERLGLA